MAKPDRSNAFRKAHREYRNKLRKGNYDQTKLNGPRKKVIWTQQEAYLVLHPTHGLSDRQLGKYLGRSVGAIQTIRAKMKKQRAYA